MRRDFVLRKHLLFILGGLLLGGTAASGATPDFSGSWEADGASGSSRAVDRVTKAGDGGYTIEQNEHRLHIVTSTGKTFNVIADGQPRRSRDRNLTARFEDGSLIFEDQSGWRETWSLAPDGRLTVDRRNANGSTSSRTFKRR